MKKTSLWLGVIALCIFVGGVVYKKSCPHNTIIAIVPYPDADVRLCETSEQKDFVRKQFRENWQFLITSPDYDIDYFLDKRGMYPYRPELEGKMNIKILYKENQPVGFNAYYMKSETEGAIFFIEVDKNHRGHRYADELVKYALADLAAQGAHYVTLCTSKTNISAQKVYDRIGFKKTKDKSNSVLYRYSFE